MFEHPQVVAEQMMTTFDHPVVGRYRGVTQPIRFGRTPGPTPFTAPTLGQDTEAVVARVEGVLHAPGA
jgi:crotonobetainyl-CoA:carnitine CoA-transferase CaiB-like acyl-CoA transferase